MARHALLLLALFVAGAVAEESDGATTPATGEQTCIAGYLPSTRGGSVDGHASAVLDIKDIEAKTGATPADYAGAKAIFLASTARSGKKWGPPADSSYPIKSGEPLGKMYSDAGHDPVAQVEAALDGTSVAAYGNYLPATAVSGTDDARAQVIKKTLKFQVLQMYAFHEIESALGKYAVGPTVAAEQDKAVHAWDEWWAFYAGKLEDGTASGYGPYILAEKRSSSFGTDTKTIKGGAKSAVTDILLRATIQGRDLLQGTPAGDNTAKLNDIVKCMRAQIKVPLIQGCLLYAHKTDITSKYNNGKTPAPDPLKTLSAKAKAEMWAFCSGVVPFLHAANGTVCPTCAAKAAAIKAEASLHTTPASEVSQANVINALDATALNAMGVKCADVGKMADATGWLVAGCTDGTVADQSAMCLAQATKCADSAKCSEVDAYNADKVCDMYVPGTAGNTNSSASSAACMSSSSPFFFAGSSMLAVTFAAAGW